MGRHRDSAEHRTLAVFGRLRKRGVRATVTAENREHAGVPRRTLHAMALLRLRLTRMPVELGVLLLVTDEADALRALDFDDYEARMRRLLDRHYGAGGYALEDGTYHSQAFHALTAYFAGDLRALDTVRVATRGTAFQERVWAALRAIPAGQTVSYGAIAKQLGKPSAVRAVGTANGKNPVGIVVPCHRVIGANASLTGYAGGLERKRWLLQHEGVRLHARA